MAEVPGKARSNARRDDPAWPGDEVVSKDADDSPLPAPTKGLSTREAVPTAARERSMEGEFVQGGSRHLVDLHLST